MGVPITYLDKHNPEQFEIVAFRKGSDGKDLVFTRESTAVLQNSHQKTCCHRELTDGISTVNACTQESSSEEKQKIKIRILNPVMGVPVTFLDKFNPEQFEIIGHEHDLNGNGGDGIKEGQFEVGNRGMYKRILIRQRLQ